MTEIQAYPFLFDLVDLYYIVCARVWKKEMRVFCCISSYLLVMHSWLIIITWFICFV